MNNIKILVGDPYLIYRTGLIVSLNEQPGISVVGEASDGNDLMQKYELLNPDLIITDISLHALSGTDAFIKLKAKHPDIKALFLAMSYDDSYINYTIKIGGQGLVGKNITTDELLVAVREIISGKNYFGDMYDELKIKDIIKKYSNRTMVFKYNPDIELSPWERIVLRYINENLSLHEIAEKIGSTKEMVDTHKIDIMRKFDLKNTSALERFAVLYSESKLN